jgi:thiamine-phosphate diphosphorylase
MLPAVMDVCARGGAELIVHAAPELTVRHGASGVHLTARQLMACSTRPLPRTYCVGASCHSVAEVDKASVLGLDYVTIGTVRPTASHPDQIDTFGLAGFAALAARTDLPAFAIGGMTADDLGTVRASGGHGVAAIRALWGRQAG